MGLGAHVALNFNNNISKATVFLDNEKVFDILWYSGLLYKLPKLTFSTGLIKLIASLLTNRKFKLLLYGEISSPKEIAAGVPKGFLPAPIYT
jgi:hypothetical protein